MNKESFADSYQRAIQQANQLIAQKDYPEAISFLIAHYEKESLMGYNQLLAQAYFLQGNHLQALQVAKEMMTDYRKIKETRIFYVQLLLMNQQFIQAWVFLYPVAKEIDVLEETQLLLEMEALLGNQSEQYLLEKTEQLKQFLAPDFYVHSTAFTKWLIGLTANQFRLIAISAIQEPTNSSVIARICEILVKTGERGTHLVYDGDQVRPVAFAELQLLEDSPLPQILQESLSKRLAKDSVLQEMVYQELLGHFAYCFPFLPKEEEVDDWVAVYLADLIQIKEPVDSAQQQYRQGIAEKKRRIQTYFENALK